MAQLQFGSATNVAREETDNGTVFTAKYLIEKCFNPRQNGGGKNSEKPLQARRIGIKEALKVFGACRDTVKIEALPHQGNVGPPGEFQGFCGFRQAKYLREGLFERFHASPAGA